MNPSSLTDKIIHEFERFGANAHHEHSWVQKIAEAIAHAVVDEIQNNASVTVTHGSSAGRYPIQ